MFFQPNCKNFGIRFSGTYLCRNCDGGEKLGKVKSLQYQVETGIEIRHHPKLNSRLLQAFECFDEHDTGTVKCDEIKKWLGDVGERMDVPEVRGTTDTCAPRLISGLQIDRFLKGPFTDRQGNFNYREWAKVLRISADNNDSDA